MLTAVLDANASAPTDGSEGVRVGCAPLRLVIADDHPIVLHGIVQLLRPHLDLEVVDTCSSGAAALDAIARHRPDIVLLDVRMPAPDGLAVLRELRGRGMTSSVILLTASVRDDDVMEAVRLGIRGLISKEALTDDLVACIRRVGSGGTSLDPALVGKAMATLLTREAALRELSQVLTPREVEIVQMVASGLRNREIAGRLFVSEGTVKVHLYRVYSKLEVTSRDQLIAYARSKGLPHR